MAATPKLAARVVVDCSVPDTSPLEEAMAALPGLIKAGDVPAVRDQLGTIEKLLARQPDRVRYVELTPEELVQRAAHEKEALEHAKELKRGQIRAALAATDHWITRAHEDNTDVPKAKLAHRKALRSLFAKVDPAKTAGALDAIVIPEPLSHEGDH